MAKPANSAATDAFETATYNEFEAATSLEQQIVILTTALQQKETEYNRNNPTLTPLNRIVVQPDYETQQVNMTVDLLLSVDAVSKSLSESVVEHIPAPC